MKKNIRIAGNIFALLAVIAAVLCRSMQDFCQPDYKDRYQWAKCLTEGLLPYRDFNMLQTPLSLYYYSVFFRFSRSLHTGLLAASLLIALTGLFLFLTARQLDKKARLLPVVIWTVFAVFGQGAIYTSMSVMFWSAALYLFFRYRRKPAFRQLVLIALLCCLCFFSKQNTGALCVCSLGLCFVYHWIRTKTPLKSALSHTAVLILCYAGFCGIWLVGFAGCGILRDFADCCLFSASEFTGAHSGADAADLVLHMLAVLAACLLMKQPELAVTGACMTLIAFPILNSPCLLPSYGIYAVLLSVLKKPEPDDKLRRFMHIAVYAAAAVFTLGQAVLSAALVCMPEALSRIYPVFGTRAIMQAQGGDLKTVAADLETRFGDGLLPYLESHQTALSDYHIADTLGAFYNIRFGRYDRYYDLFLAGNLGSRTPAEIVNETIRNESGHYFIIWADAESQSVPNFQDAAVQDAIREIRQRCILTETLYQKDGETPSYCIYQIP